MSTSFPSPAVVFLTSIWGLAGCTAPFGEGFSSPDTNVPDGHLTDVVVDNDPKIPSVVHVRWAFSEPSAVEAYVEYGLVNVTEFSAPAFADGEGGFHALLLGLKAGREYVLRPVVQGEGGTCRGERVHATAGLPSPHFPQAEVWASESSTLGDSFLVTTIGGSWFSAVVFDGDGDLVWWYPNEPSELFVPRAALSRNREWMILLDEAILGSPTQESRLLFVSLDGSDQFSITVHGANHDFVELPGGVIALITYDSKTIVVDGIETPATADAIVELHPDGKIVPVWSAWEHAEEWQDHVYAGDDSWTHANAIDYDEARDVYHLGLPSLSMIVTIDRSTGTLLSRMGGLHSDYAIQGVEGSSFDWQHQFEFEGNRLMVFDNAGALDGNSRVMEYTLDASTMEASPRLVHVHTPPLFCYMMGDVMRLAGGNTLVTWSTAGVLEEVSAAGEIVWSVGMEIANGFGYTTRVDTLYPE